jgi:hypothetical protein
MNPKKGGKIKMKTKALKKKLSFNKETVSNLNVSETKNLKGGATGPLMCCTEMGTTCNTCYLYCPIPPDTGFVGCDKTISCDTQQQTCCYIP